MEIVPARGKYACALHHLSESGQTEDQEEMGDGRLENGKRLEENNIYRIHDMESWAPRCFRLVFDLEWPRRFCMIVRLHG